jgi:uncharacterized protein HemY
MLIGHYIRANQETVAIETESYDCRTNELRTFLASFRVVFVVIVVDFSTNNLIN